MAITPEQFRKNLTLLKEKLPLKPDKYTSIYPKTIEECLSLYCNQRTTHLLQTSTILLHEKNWPLPLWYNPNQFKVGFFNRLYILISPLLRKKYRKDKGFGYSSYLTTMKILSKRDLDEIIVEAFDSNRKYAFKKLENHPLLRKQATIINSIKNSYSNKNYTACITTILPLIDFICRKFLQSTNLTHSVGKITKLFQKSGFSLENPEDLMPMMNFHIKLNEESDMPINFLEYFEKMKEFDFGIIGCALSSFVRFANTYYSLFIEDNSDENCDILNRHAILHGASINFGTKENCIKLISFLLLMLELEKIFNILLSDEEKADI